MRSTRASANSRSTRRTARTSLACRNGSKRVRPGLDVVLRVSLEMQLRRHVDTETSARHVLALDGEFEAVKVADRAVGDVEGDIWRWVTLEVVVVLEAVEEPSGRNDVEA